MLKLMSIFLLFFYTINYCLSNGSLEEVVNFGKNKGNLKMFIHPPKEIDINNQALVVVLHGCSQNAEKVKFQSGWSELADKYNFMVIYPEQKLSNNVSGCFNWFYKKDIAPNSGESSSILEMIEYVKHNYSIDPSRVFIYGLSAGAAMTINLLANNPDTFNSGASLAGGPYGLATNFIQAAKGMINPPNKTAKEWGELIPKSKSGKYPKLIIVHGTKDNTVDFRNANELIKQWTYIHNIDFNDRIITQQFEGNPLIEKTTFPDKKNETPIIFYKVKDIGHALPVNPGTEVNEGGNTGMFAVDCDFFSTYYIAKDFGLIQN